LGAIEAASLPPANGLQTVHQKLASHFYGPYLILEKCGPIAYKLQLLENAHIHLIFHVSRLKRYHSNDGQAEPQQIDLPPVTDEGVAILEPQTILDTHLLKHGANLLKKAWSNGSIFQPMMPTGS
jgi:hypothetical protein